MGQKDCMTGPKLELAVGSHTGIQNDVCLFESKTGQYTVSDLSL